jgi:hypothetical protein
MTDREEAMLRQLISERENLLASALLNPNVLRSKIDHLRDKIARMRKERGGR